MGYALAQAALDRGAGVTLISGPTNLRPPYGAKLVNIETARDMETAVHAEVSSATMLVMSAAVSDFRPRTQFGSKLKKEKVGGDLTIELDRNPDIIAGVSDEGLFKIGFAAETDDLLANAADKLQSKGLAMIVANDAVATIGSDGSTASCCSAMASGTTTRTPKGGGSGDYSGSGRSGAGSGPAGQTPGEGPRAIQFLACPHFWRAIPGCP